MIYTIATSSPGSDWEIISDEPPADWAAALKAYQGITPDGQLYGNDKA